MSFDGTGQYNLPAPEYPAIPNEVIYAETFNTIMQDIADALSAVLVADGQTVMSGDLDLGGNFLINGEIDSQVTGFTQAPATNDTTLATTAFVQAIAFLAALPGISASTKGKFVTNNGSTASWSVVLPSFAAVAAAGGM